MGSQNTSRNTIVYKKNYSIGSVHIHSLNSKKIKVFLIFELTKEIAREKTNGKSRKRERNDEDRKQVVDYCCCFRITVKIWITHTKEKITPPWGKVINRAKSQCKKLSFINKKQQLKKIIKKSSVKFFLLSQLCVRESFIINSSLPHCRDYVYLFFVRSSIDDISGVKKAIKVNFNITLEAPSR